MPGCAEHLSRFSFPGRPTTGRRQPDLRKRQRGFSEGQFIESIALLQAVGGECPEDMRLIKGDECLERGLGYELPRA